VSPLRSSAGDIVAALQAAVQRIPGVIVYARDHCHGYDWMINPDTVEVHVNGQLSPAEYSAARAEALAALQLHLENKTACPQSAPTQLDELAARRQRRTS
jgi:hypothetical protein